MDSRIQHKLEHLNAAREACRSGDPETAAKELGIALHPLQDYYAHGDYGRSDRDQNGGYWQVHNKFSPQTPIPGKSDLSHYPDDPELDAVKGPGGRPAGAAIKLHQLPTFKTDYAIYEYGTQRIRDTEAATTDTLSSFLDFVRRTCGECCKYFGVGK